MSINKKSLIWGLSRECLGQKPDCKEKGLLIADKGPLCGVNFQIRKQQLFQSDGFQRWLHILIPGEF